MLRAKTYLGNMVGTHLDDMEVQRFDFGWIKKYLNFAFFERLSHPKEKYKFKARRTLNPKEAGWSIWLPPYSCGLSKIVFSRERVKPWFLVTFNTVDSRYNKPRREMKNTLRSRINVVSQQKNLNSVKRTLVIEIQ